MGDKERHRIVRCCQVLVGCPLCRYGTGDTPNSASVLFAARFLRGFTVHVG